MQYSPIHNTLITLSEFFIANDFNCYSFFIDGAGSDLCDGHYHTLEQVQKIIGDNKKSKIYFSSHDDYEPAVDILFDGGDKVKLIVHEAFSCLGYHCFDDIPIDYRQDKKTNYYETDITLSIYVDGFVSFDFSDKGLISASRQYFRRRFDSNIEKLLNLYTSYSSVKFMMNDDGESFVTDYNNALIQVDEKVRKDKNDIKKYLKKIFWNGESVIDKIICVNCDLLMVEKMKDVTQEYKGKQLKINTNVTLCESCGLILLTDKQANKLLKKAKDIKPRKKIDNIFGIE